MLSIILFKFKCSLNLILFIDNKNIEFIKFNNLFIELYITSNYKLLIILFNDDKA